MPERAVLDHAVHQYYERYADGDLGGLDALWSEGHIPAPIRLSLRNTFRARCITVKRLEVTSVSVAGDAVDVAAEVDIEKQDRVTGQIFAEWQHPIFHFVRDGASWRIGSLHTRERDLSTKIATAATSPEVWSAIAADIDSVNPLMVQELCDYTIWLVNQDRIADANKANERLLQVADFLGDPSSMSLARGADSILVRVRPSPDLPASVEHSIESLALAERSGDPDLLSRALLNLARAYEASDSYAKAAPLFERVLQLGDRLENWIVLPRAAFQLAGVESAGGDYRAALRSTEIGRRYLDAEVDHLGLFQLELGLGEIFQAEGDYEIAVAHYRRAADVAESIRFQNGISGSLMDIADCYLNLGDEVRFRAAAAEALTSARKGSRPEDVASMLTEIGADALEHGDLAAADRTLTESLAKAESGLDPSVVAGSLETLSLLRLRQERYHDAIGLATRAADLRTKNGSPDQLDAWVIAAKAYRALGDGKAAEGKLREAVTLAERSRGLVTGDERQMRLFFKSRVAAHLNLVDLLVEEGRAAEALEIAEQAKGRTLLDALRSSGSAQKPQMPAGERVHQEQLESTVADASRALAQARTSGNPPAEIAKAVATVDASRVELESFRALFSARESRLPHDVSPLTAAQLAAIVPPRSVAIEYVVTDSRLLVFAIQHGGRNKPKITVHSVTIRRETIERKVHRFVSLVAQRSLEYEVPARDLYRILIRPVAGELAQSRAVCVIPDSLLWSLPFEALVAPDGHFVAERQAMFYTPSITVWREMTAEQSRSTARNDAFFGIANPHLGASTMTDAKAFYRGGELGLLPDAEREVESIAALYGADRSAVYVGASALEGRVKQEIASYRVIHFATHGVIDDRNPMYSYLLLSRSGPNDPDDGLLEAREMMQLDLHADLAVLSACDTARGSVDAGEGLIGMTWALFAAGCPSTIASQWKVDSQATASLMIAFYRAWLGTKHDAFAKATALRRARLEMIHDGLHRHPYYWSAFVLVGAGG